MASSSTSSHQAQHLPYIPGLDGLRALSVLAVVLYHAGMPVSGGFLGVESFFVISGYLITALLLVEWQQQRRIDLRAFWIRRGRRLLPALMFMLAGTLMFASVRLRDERTNIFTDALSALGYIMNWRLILSGQSYFDPLLRPPLLQHLWSLAVEEQFYLLWPLLLAAGMHRLRQSRLVLVTIATAVGSAVLMAWLYRPGADPSRMYFGTDTRLAGLLVGAALAMVWTPGSQTVASNPQSGRLFDGAGILALGGLIACFAWLSSHHPLLYRGGFGLIAILTAIVIAALTHPFARCIPRLLAWPPLQALGLRSYGIYLWHWPVFMVTRPFVDLPFGGLLIIALRLAIVAALVELSYRCIEQPVRYGRWPRAAVAIAHGAHRRALTMPHPSNPYVIGVLCLLLPSLLLLAASRPGFPARRVPPSTPSVVAFGAAPPTRLTSTHPATSVATPTMVTSTPTARLEGTATGQLLTPTTGSTELPPLDPDLVARLQTLLDDTVSDGYVPGATLSIRIPGYLPWSGSSGVAHRATGTPMVPDTRIHISSITKMFTSVVVLQLVDEGAIELDAPIGTYLADIVPFAGRTTVRQLLNHTSGVFDYLEDSQFFIEAYQNPDNTYTPSELVGMVDQYGAAFEPGTPDAWKYSSTNYVILGMLVEQVTGNTMAEETRRRIFEPLDLRQTFFAPYEAVVGTVAEGYIGTSDRADVSMTFVFATGNIISTAGDLRQFADALFDGKLLHAGTLAQMTSTVDTGGAYDMPELEYGLGLMRARLNIGTGPDGARRPDQSGVVLGHIGGIAGSRAAVWRAPERGITIALGLNQANIDPNLLARDTLEVILAWQGQ